MKNLNSRRRILLVAAVILIIAIVIIAIIFGSSKDRSNAEDGKTGVSIAFEQIKIGEEGAAELKSTIEELQKEYKERIANSQEAGEAEKLRKEFEQKAQAAVDNKMKASVVSAKPSDGLSNVSSGGASAGSGAGNNAGTAASKPSHTHIAEGNMGWSDSPAGIRAIFNSAVDEWKAKIAAGDTISPEPINFSYKRCSCGKYTGKFEYGSPHSHIATGNTGRWFSSQAEAEVCYREEQKYWENLAINGQISWEECEKNEPYRWECRQCSCGKYTLSWYTKG